MPDPRSDQTPPASLEQLERAYEKWYRQYAATQRRRRSGVYRAAGEKIAVGVAEPRSRWRNLVRGVRSVGFFPRTSLGTFAFRCASTEQSLATDWALVGADLYAAIQEGRKE